MRILNGSSVNGSVLPTWVVRAVVAAVAAATVSLTPVRTSYAACIVSAVASYGIAQTQTHQAKATGAASAGVGIETTYIMAANATTVAGSYGAALVRRDVFGSAGGDAFSSGLALSAQALGNVDDSTTAGTVVLCEAHRIRFGASVGSVLATKVTTTNVKTTYGSVATAFGQAGDTRAEASKRLSGDSFYSHDGYVLLHLAESTGTVIQDRTKIIAGFGSFDFATTLSSSKAHVVYSGHVNQLGYLQSSQATAVRFAQVQSTSLTECTATAIPSVYRYGLVSGSAGSVVYTLKAWVRYQVAITRTAHATAAVTPLRTAYGFAVPGVAQVTAPVVVPGNQHRASTSNTALANIQAVGFVTYSGFANVDAFVVSTDVFGVANSDTLAPASRYMHVSQELRGMALTNSTVPTMVISS